MGDDERWLDDYRGLRDPAVRARYEREHGIFVAEGATVVRRLLASGLAVRSVVVLEGKEHVVAGLLPAGVPLLVLDRGALRDVAGFDVHRGVLACAERPAPCRVHDVAARSEVVAVLEGLNDHENLGAIIRSAEALGVDGLVLDPTCADPWYRRSVRVSMGAVLTLPVARAASWPADLGVVRDAGHELVALTPSPAAEPLDAYVASRGAKVALLLGAEGPGLSAAALAAADRHVRIPLRAGADSLNVGHAAAVAFAALGRV